MVTADPKLPFAWNAVTFPRERYVYFALRDPRMLRHTILWISNGGRHYAPWNGRHVNVMGLEEITGNFHMGLAESAQRNPLNERGVAVVVITNQSDTLSPGTVGEFYCCGNLFASGGVQPYTWSVVAGALPPGLELPRRENTISGTPTTAGTFTFTVRVTDDLGAFSEKEFSITIS